MLNEENRPADPKPSGDSAVLRAGAKYPPESWRQFLVHHTVYEVSEEDPEMLGRGVRFSLLPSLKVSVANFLYGRLRLSMEDNKIVAVDQAH